MPHLVKEENRYLEDAPVDRLRLLSDRILVRVLKKRKRTDAGLILIHGEYKVKTSIGRVLKLGEEYEGSLVVGDYVYFKEWTGREFQSVDETLCLLRPGQVEAIIET